MKLFTLIFLITSSLSVFASNQCLKIFYDKELYEIVQDSNEFEVKLQKDIKYPSALMKKEKVEVVDNKCKTAVLEVIRHKPTNQVFKVIYTNEDYCDGGNSYGFISTTKNKIIATISDSFITCK